MHRSGTSAVARVLSILGADLPKNLIPPAADNPRGFWEAHELMVLHEELLIAAGSSWDDWTRLEPACLETGIVDRFRARLLAFLEAEFAGSDMFVIKDPRICRLVPFWRAILQEFGANVHVAIPVRNPMEVAASLARRNGFSMAQGLLIWLRHALDAERETRDLRRGVFRFGDLLHDRQRVLAVLRRRLAIKWPRPVTGVRTELDDFLSIAERHHSTDDRSLDRRGDVPAWVRRAYDALVAIARDGESPQVHAELDRIGSDLDHATATFGPILTDRATANRAQTAEIDELRRSSEQRAAEAGGLQRDLATVHSALLERSAEAERVAGELAAARAELTETRADLVQRLAEAQRLSGELSALRGILEERSSEVAQLRDALVQSEALRGILADREANLAKLVPQIDYMVHSFSWRLTAPLRAVRGLLGSGEK
jgi:hypothetical protein